MITKDKGIGEKINIENGGKKIKEREKRRGRNIKKRRRGKYKGVESGGRSRRERK